MPKITVGLAMTLLIIGNIIGVFSDACRCQRSMSIKWDPVIFGGNKWEAL